MGERSRSSCPGGQNREDPTAVLGQFFKEAITQMIRYPVRGSAQVISSPSASSGRNMIRYYFDDPVLQKALRERARRDGGTFSDLCLAAAKLALQEWNEGRGKPPQVMHHWLAVNQRLRQARTQTSTQNNPLIAIDIPSLPADRKDAQALLRHVISHRVRMLDGGFDVALHRLATRNDACGKDHAHQHTVSSRSPDHGS